jgi:ATP-dependent DNA ligase I
MSQHRGAPPTSQQREAELDEQYPDRPYNHGPTFAFHTLCRDLFKRLIDNKNNKATAKPVARRKVGPDGRGPKSPHQLRDDIINQYISKWRQEVGNDFFPALRLIIPDKDRERGVYGLKEKVIAKLLIKIVRIDKNSEDGFSLLHWKDPGQQRSKVAGDFAGRAYEALVKRPMRNDYGNMTIEEVNDELDRLSSASKEQEQLLILEKFYRRMNPEELMWLIRVILKDMHVGATEKTFFRLWHPDAEDLFNVSSNLRRVCWDLSDPEKRIDEKKGAITVGQCFQPMLAEMKNGKPLKYSVAAMGATAEDPEFWIEEKLDGERIQMHMWSDPEIKGGRRFRWWSRKAKEYTYLYGEGVDDKTGALSQFLEDAFAKGVESIILDGEMITWNTEEKATVPFGTLKTAALATERNPYGRGHRPVFRIFDILLLNDTPLIRYELRDRRKALASSVISVPERFEIHDYVAATAVEEVEDLLRNVVAEASEGLIMKNPRSPYLFDDRGEWQKVKPEYMEGYGEELDCCIIGGYYGSGRRGGQLSSFLCGLRASSRAVQAASQRATQSQSQNQSQSQSQSQRQPSQSQARDSRKAVPNSRARADSTQSQYHRHSSPIPSQSQSQADTTPVENFITFFRVGGGMSANDYASIRHHCEGKWIDWKSKRPSWRDYIDLGGNTRVSLKEKPDKWIKPSDSLVVQVKAAQVVESEDYGFEYTLRFPRFVKIRRDRDWTTALSKSEFEDLKSVAKEREEQKRMEADTARAQKRKATTSSRKKKPLTIAGYNAKTLNNIKLPNSPTTNVFHNLTFFVMTESALQGDWKKSKPELEALVKAHGGSIVQTAHLNDTSTGEEVDVLCIAARRTVKVASLEKHGTKPIIRPIWVFDCIEQAKRDMALGYFDEYEYTLQFEPGRHLFFTPADRIGSYDMNIGDYDDSLTRDTNVDELRQTLDNMKSVKNVKEDEKGFRELFGDEVFNMKGFLFLGMTFFFDRPGIDGDPDTERNGTDSDLDTDIDEPTSLRTIAKFASASIVPSTSSTLSAVPKAMQEEITHIIAHPNSDLKDIRQEIAIWHKEGKKIPYMMKAEWIEQCWREGTRVDEEAYIARARSKARCGP